MYNSLRSHMTMGTAALFGAAAIAMHPVTGPTMADVSTAPAVTHVTQTLEVALVASILDKLPGVEVLGPAPAECGKSCGPYVSHNGGEPFACGPSPTCYISQLYIRPVVDKLFQGIAGPVLNFLLPGYENAGMGALFIVPLALVLSPILVPIRIVQNLIPKPTPTKPAAAARAINAAAARAATGSPAAPKAAAVARASRTAAPAAARASRNAAVLTAPKAAASKAAAKAGAPLKGKLRAALARNHGN